MIMVAKTIPNPNEIAMGDELIGLPGGFEAV